MPRGNRRGPMGEGPRTGRGQGYCNNYSQPGYVTSGGAGLGFGKGGGNRGPGGHRHWFHRTGRPFWGRFANWDGYSAPQTPAPASEKEIIRDEINFHKSNLANLEQRLTELEKQEKSVAE